MTTTPAAGLRQAGTACCSKAATPPALTRRPLSHCRRFSDIVSFSQTSSRSAYGCHRGWRRHVLRLQRPRAAEEGAGDSSSPAEQAEDSGEEIKVEVEGKSASAQEEEHLRPYYDSLLERGRVALAEGKGDAGFLESFLSDVEGELGALLARATAAEAQLAIMESQVTGSQDRYLRLNADFDNFRKRSGNEKAALADSAKAKVLELLLPVIDAFEAAKDSLKLETEEEKKVDASYQGLYKQLVEAFRGMGLEVVPGVGSPFDPELHEGIMREADNSVPDGTILQEFRRGFKIGDRLLRASMVKVSYQDESAASDAAGEAAAEPEAQAVAE